MQPRLQAHVVGHLLLELLLQLLELFVQRLHRVRYAVQVQLHSRDIDTRMHGRTHEAAYQYVLCGLSTAVVPPHGLCGDLRARGLHQIGHRHSVLRELGRERIQ